jgi:Metal-independent alpha-mannosidase (GH125)
MPSLRLLLLHLALQCGNGLMHESVSVHDLGKCTRPWFEWANAMLVVFAENALGLDCSSAAEQYRLAQIQVRTLRCSAVDERFLTDLQLVYIYHSPQK